MQKLTDANNQDYIEVKNTWGENYYPYFEVNLDGTSRLNGDINVKLLRDQFGRFGHCYYVDLRHDQGETHLCWDYAAATSIRKSLRIKIGK